MNTNVRLLVVVVHAAFDAARREAFAPLRADLERQARDSDRLFVYEDYEAKGSLGPFLRACREALETRGEHTHVAILPDDAILAPDFLRHLRAFVARFPDEIVCCQTNHEVAPWASLTREEREEQLSLRERAELDATGQAGRTAALRAALSGLPDEACRAYTTPDGATLFGGVFPVKALRDHLAWRESALLGAGLGPDTTPGTRKVEGDEGVNLWCMATGRLVYKPLPGLVDHDTRLPSLDGNDEGPDAQSPRRTLTFGTPPGGSWNGPVAHLGRTYRGNHWNLVFDVRPSAWDVERMYEVDRGRPVSAAPHVAILVPCAKIELGFLHGFQKLVASLEWSGIGVTTVLTPGDSLVTRGRHLLAHRAMQTSATHFLWLDSDVECLDERAVQKMVATGRPVVGCAYPFRNASGKVVGEPKKRVERVDHVLRVEHGEITIDEDGTLPAEYLGTGFLLVERRVFAALMKAHPETLYQHDLVDDQKGAPLWALMHDPVVARKYGEGHRRKLLAEDWHFTRLCDEAGFDPRLYVPPVLRHWGTHGHEGHFLKEWGFRVLGDPAPATATEEQRKEAAE